MKTTIPGPICDICGKARSFGNNTYKHTRCSKIRQARHAAERAAKGEEP